MFNFFRKIGHLYDLVEYPDDMRTELVHRFPEKEIGDIRIGTYVLVQEKQVLVLTWRGKITDVLGPGQHIVTTANIQEIIKNIGASFDERKPFPIEGYFVSTRDFQNLTWKTPGAIVTQTASEYTSFVASGTYSVSVYEPKLAVQYAIDENNKPTYPLVNLDNHCQKIIHSSLRKVLSEFGNGKSALAIMAEVEKITTLLEIQVSDQLQKNGFRIKDLYIQELVQTK